MSDPVGIGLYVLRNLISQRAQLMQRHIHEPDFESYTDGLDDAMGADDAGCRVAYGFRLSKTAEFLFYWSESSS